MAVSLNADDYTTGRINIFFPAHNNTPLDGNLTGQCVTLLKWFFAEMTSIPSPFSARGHARYVGKTLVAQGHAVEVPYDQRRRGDIVCYEYGEYGHISLILSGGRVFEQNVNLGGVARKVVDGAMVYASRIGGEGESWRSGKNPHIYRLKTYSEGGTMDKPVKGDVDNILGELWGRPPNPEDYGYTNQSWHDFIYGAMAAYPWRDRYHILQVLYPQACIDRDTNLQIAEQRSQNFGDICDAHGVVRLPDEQVTTKAINAKYVQAINDCKVLEAEVKKLQGENTALQKQLDDLKNGDNIIITKDGWTALFDVIKQFFAKKK